MAAFTPTAQTASDTLAEVMGAAASALNLPAAEQFKAALSEVLRGWTADDEVVDCTPRRVLAALVEMTAGYEIDPGDLLATRFAVPGDDLVILKDVDFVSLCEHHLMPFAGVVHLGYLPAGEVVGVSKLARLVECFSRRLQIQERMGTEIAAALMEHLEVKGAAVVIEASHACMACRGVRKQRATFVTSSMLGEFRSDSALRQEFFQAVRS